MPIVRALESASVSVLLNKLATQDVIDFFLKWKIDDSLRAKLKSNLLVIHAVLNHAEEKQVQDSNVKAWLEDVRVAAYDAEDILGDIANDALDSQNSKYKVCNSEVKEAIDFKMKDIGNTLNPFGERIESKMKGIIDTLEDIAKQKDILRLREDSGGIKSGFDRLPTTPMLGDESHVYDREADKKEIITLLKLGENDNEKVASLMGTVPTYPLKGLSESDCWLLFEQIVFRSRNLNAYPMLYRLFK